MNYLNEKVDLYLSDGCGRCERYKTESCSVVPYRLILSKLRELILDCGLNEELKWSHPCYTYNSKNVLLLGALKTHCSLSFIKGSLINDPTNLLKKIGENTEHGRWIKFKKMEDFTYNFDEIKTFIFQAIEIEKSGLKLEYKKPSEMSMPNELIIRLNEDPVFNEYWNNLTPGRQKSWIIHFSSAKKEQTVINRINKALPKILKGKGWNEY